MHLHDRAAGPSRARSRRGDSRGGAGRRAILRGALGLLLGPSLPGATLADAVEVPSGLAHGEWERLLSVYVDERGLVDYRRWQEWAADREALDRYLGTLEGSASRAEGEEQAAALINAYNALAIAWILAHYPISSIQSLDDSFTERRHRVGGRQVSLDDIEHATLRPLAGFRVHAALVCAARSCPPLARRAYTAAGLSAQLDDAMARWLARPDLNRFAPAARRVQISPIFKWYREDFEGGGGVRAVLARYAPARHREFLRGEYAIDYLPYHWGLNDQRGLGQDYGWAGLIRDFVRNIFR